MADMFQRKYKEDRPVVAICYDFDRTLSPDDMQAQGFIQRRSATMLLNSGRSRTASPAGTAWTATSPGCTS
jgi:hypothetical protein